MYSLKTDVGRLDLLPLVKHLTGLEAQIPSGDIMPITVQPFVDRLTETGLLSASEIAPFHDGPSPERRPRDVPAGRLLESWPSANQR
jgi:hypothetical protein